MFKIFGLLKTMSTRCSLHKENYKCRYNLKEEFPYTTCSGLNENNKFSLNEIMMSDTIF